MAVCKRCGKSFDYQKREGVCPKCCFYNRPEGTWKEDDSWIKNYNYEDNSYDVTVSSYEDDTKEDKWSHYLNGKDKSDTDSGRKVTSRHASKEVDGSHSHLSDGRVVRGSDPTGRKVSKKKNKSGSARNSKISWVFIILFLYWLFFLIRAIFGIIL